MQRRTPTIVLIDDDLWTLQTLETVLSPLYQVSCFTSPAAAEHELTQNKTSIAILDLNFPGQDGLDTLKKWKKIFPELDIILCSGESRVERAIECLRSGASDYLVKPFQSQDLLWMVNRVLEKKSLHQKVERLSSLIHPRPIHWIGQSPEARALLGKVAVLKNQPQLNVLLLGESGTGKEVVARLLHQQEDDAQRPLVIANMPAIPATLMESELFGVEKGAFTDAKISRPGKFEMADGGDIFLDEIGDLALEMQAKLLRTLQERQVERVGSSRTREVDFRVISATNRPLSQLMENGIFREDLIYRLSDVVLRLPPLRERKQDIPELAGHFIQKYFKGAPSLTPRLSAEALQKLIAFSWPGNVRQLESTIKRALVFNCGSILDKVELYDSTIFNPNQPPSLIEDSRANYEQMIEEYERNLLSKTLQKFHGNKRAAAESLQLSRATFYRKVQELKV